MLLVSFLKKKISSLCVHNDKDTFLEDGKYNLNIFFFNQASTEK